MKVKFFTNNNIDKLEAQINDWMLKEKVGPSDLFKVCQTEDKTRWTVSIWYLQFKTSQ